MKWINKGSLKWRTKDLYSSEQGDPVSLDTPINDRDRNPTTRIEQISETGLRTPTLSGLDGYIEQHRQQEMERIFLELERYVLDDPDGRLRNCHPRNRPDVNCQVLSQRLLYNNPPERLSGISREFDINDKTLLSHWKRRCRPLLQEILESLGYSRNQEL